MPKSVKVYISLVICIGLAVLATGLSLWQSSDVYRYLSYLLLALLAATLKVKLPGVSGTFSASFLFVLIGIADLTLSETLSLGCAAAVIQSYWRPKKRPRFIQVLFNVANLAISISVARLVAYSALARDNQQTLAVLLMLAACAFFVTNTVTVSGVLALIDKKPLRTVWRHWFIWSFPYYLVGAAIAALISASSQSMNWKAALFALPVLYLVYFYYRLYVEGQPGATEPRP